MSVTFSLGTKSPSDLQLNGWLPCTSGCVSPHVPAPGMAPIDGEGTTDAAGLGLGLGMELGGACACSIEEC
jgi:hypothetical protein